jgi:hypothetical protein
VSDASSKVEVFDGVAFLSRGDVVLALWKAPARIHRAKWLFDHVDRVIAERPGGVLAAYFILSSSSPPDGPARAENQRRIQAIGASFRRLLLVPIGDALWTSIVRTVMRGVAIVTGNKNLAVANGVADALDKLLAARSERTPSRRELEAAVAVLFDALGVGRPERELIKT